MSGMRWRASGEARVESLRRPVRMGSFGCGDSFLSKFESEVALCIDLAQVACISKNRSGAYKLVRAVENAPQYI